MSGEYWKPQFVVDRSFEHPLPFLVIPAVVASLGVGLLFVAAIGYDVDWVQTGFTAGVLLVRIFAMAIAALILAALAGKKLDQNAFAATLSVLSVIWIVSALFGFASVGLLLLGTDWRTQLSFSVLDSPGASIAEVLRLGPPELPGIVFGVLALIFIVQFLWTLSVFYRLVRRLLGRGFIASSLATIVLLVIYSLVSFGVA